MYTVCLFCHTSLGSNELVESFPIGRRLAFDSAKGRLWVVCKSCGQWNLTPLEERWEALDRCEQLYRDTRIRASTDNIGLARFREGLDLIRIGKPMLPEFAAWRYGARFSQRRTRALAASVLTTGALVYFGSGLGVFMFMIGGPVLYAIQNVLYGKTEVGAARKLMSSALKPSYDLLPVSQRPKKAPDSRKIEVRLIATGDVQRWGLRLENEDVSRDFAGGEALSMAHLLLPAVNHAGAGSRLVRRAVREIENARDPRWYPRQVLQDARRGGLLYSPITEYPRPVRLALEMAAHEESERQLIEGELKQLEESWRAAEEIAAIADNLLVPTHVEEWLLKVRRLPEDQGKQHFPDRQKSRSDPDNG